MNEQIEPWVQAIIDKYHKAMVQEVMAEYVKRKIIEPMMARTQEALSKIAKDACSHPTVQ